MTYWALNAIFLAVVAGLAVAGILARRTARGRAVAITLAVLLVMTAVFDNAMIAVGLVGYDPALITGAKLGIAPLEDFAYALAAVVLLPVLWHLLPARAGRAADAARSASVVQEIRPGDRSHAGRPGGSPAERSASPAERSADPAERRAREAGGAP